MRGISAGPEFKWLQPVLGGRDPRILLAQGYGGRVYDTIRMLQTDPSVKVPFFFQHLKSAFVKLSLFDFNSAAIGTKTCT